MKILTLIFTLVLFGLVTSCVSNKKFAESQTALENCEQEKTTLTNELDRCELQLNAKEDQIKDLQKAIDDLRELRDKQLMQVGDLTVLSREANENITKTLDQLAQKEKYIRMLQEAKSKADSINLALAVNLKSALNKGIEDEDIQIEVDKTVVFVNLSDKMLYRTASASLTTRAKEILSKIATVLKGRNDIDIMVEGYTDDVPMKNECIDDNWDLSVKRATSVVRLLQGEHGINPDQLIAAGRGEYNALTTNTTSEGRALNRRTRIIILPKLNQFYDLLDPTKVPK